MTIKIYALHDPRTDEIRYVGQTYRSLKIRLCCHLHQPSKTYKYRWIQKLKREGVSPTIHLLEECETREEANTAEKNWISVLPRFGVNLTNLTAGGGGISGWKHSLETKSKISGSNKGKHPLPSEEARRRALLNTRPRKEHLAAQMKTTKYKEALSSARKKQWQDPEYREKMSTMSQETWKDPTVAAKRMVGLERTRHCPKRAENIRKALRDPEVQRRRIETRRRNKEMKG